MAYAWSESEEEDGPHILNHLIPSGNALLATSPNWHGPFWTKLPPVPVTLSLNVIRFIAGMSSTLPQSVIRLLLRSRRTCIQSCPFRTPDLCPKKGEILLTATISYNIEPLPTTPRQHRNTTNSLPNTPIPQRSSASAI